VLRSDARYIASLPLPDCLCASVNLGCPNAERIRDLEDVGQARIPLASLDPAHSGNGFFALAIVLSQVEPHELGRAQTGLYLTF
jgi:hypothetical protein